MNGPDNYLAAEKLLSSVDDREKAFTPVEAVNAVIAVAQVHATLALAAATIDAATQSYDEAGHRNARTWWQVTR